jgi:hypothetical protein
MVIQNEVLYQEVDQECDLIKYELEKVLITQQEILKE